MVESYPTVLFDHLQKLEWLKLDSDHQMMLINCPIIFQEMQWW